MLVKACGGSRRLPVGKNRPQQAGIGAGDRPFIALRRGNDHVHGVNRPGHGHVQHAQRLLDDLPFMGVEHRLESTGQQGRKPFDT